jgi:hypothetical protein
VSCYAVSWWLRPETTKELIVLSELMQAVSSELHQTASLREQLFVSNELLQGASPEEVDTILEAA